jgi:hypothetical protein
MLSKGGERGNRDNRKRRQIRTIEGGGNFEKEFTCREENERRI